MITFPSRPFPLAARRSNIALMVIDMQRDFVEPGGFGASLGNDVTRLTGIIPQVARLLAAFRAKGMTVIHTKEAHRADLSDCPPAKRRRGDAEIAIGDEGPMGRILISGEPGNDIVPELYPENGELVIEKPGKGAFYATDLNALLDGANITHLVFAGVITVALLDYKTDEWAGYVEGEDERGKDWEGIHHIGFWVDDLEETEKKIEAAGGKYFQGRPTEKAPSTFYEMKFRDPHGVIVDCTHLGWGGSVKDVVPADAAEREKLERRAATKAPSQAAE